MLAMLVGGGYPIQSWWWGVPHPVMGDTLGTPHHPDLARVWVPWVPPTIQTWLGGYPGYPPPSRPGMGYPSPSRPEMGYPCHPDLRWGTPPPRPGMGYLPPPMVKRQTFPSINITFPCTTYAGGNSFIKITKISSLAIVTLSLGCHIKSISLTHYKDPSFFIL